MKLRLVLVWLVLPIAALAWTKARLYDLDSGTIATLEYSNKWWTGHGTIRGVLAGEFITGEFSTIATRTDVQQGSATLSGKGIVIDCEYSISTLNQHGSGTCTDNHGRRYRLTF